MRPKHSPDDIIGYKETAKIFAEIFEACEDPETAVSALLVSGPNGGGKTYQMQAYAKKSERVVIELSGLRGSYFGETDKFWELLKWNIATFGKILILVDEAHTAFGSVHSKDTHETEKRLAGNVIKMMGDPAFLSKVVWGLMTSRPDELDPDTKSRAPFQIPIFDLEGEERREFVRELFAREHIDVSAGELEEILPKTDYYSNRDFRNLLAQVLFRRRKESAAKVMEVLQGWHASKSIRLKREFQTLLAVQHCTYPQLLPLQYRDMSEETVAKRIAELKYLLNQ